VSASWVLVGAVVAYVLLRRRRAWVALLLFAGYVGGTYLLVLSGRGSALGAELGTDTRYLSDIPIVLALCVGLATARLLGAPGSSEPREPALIAKAPVPLTASLLAVVVVGGISSSVGYVRPWHDSAAHDFFQRLDRDIAARGGADLADRVLPEDVMSQLAAPRNNLSYLAPLLTDTARFPNQASSLLVVDDDGELSPAEIDRVAPSRPATSQDADGR
jgi:hypothetical protein